MFNSVYLNKLKMEFHIPYCYLKIKFLRLWKFSFTMKNSTYKTIILTLSTKIITELHMVVIYSSEHLNRNEPVKLLSRVQLFATPWAVAYQAPPSMDFSRQKYWSGLPFPSPGRYSQPRDWTQVSHIAGRCFTVWATKEARNEILIKCHKYVSG